MGGQMCFVLYKKFGGSLRDAYKKFDCVGKRMVTMKKLMKNVSKKKKQKLLKSNYASFLERKS